MSQKKNSGFTLIELMIVVVIVAIFAAIAIPSYQMYIRKAEAAQAQQEMLRVANLLEQHKARNFNYRGFNLNNQSLVVPKTYSFELVDASDTSKLLTAADAVGQAWIMKVVTTNPENFNFLLNSSGMRCKNKAKDNVTYTVCGRGEESW
jgi:type IV pilus assembly protein PilE